WLLLKCPCGCGDEIPVNLDRRAGKAWRIYRSGKGLTLFPSVWRDTGCQSHFIVWRDQILLFGERDDEVSQSPSHPDLLTLANRILAAWPRDGWISYVEIADLLGEIPWDALDACRYLARTGALIEGRADLRTQFRRV